MIVKRKKKSSRMSTRKSVRSPKGKAPDSGTPDSAAADMASSIPGWWSWALAVGAGVAGGLAFEPFALRPLLVAFPVGMFLAVRLAPSPRGALARMWLGMAVFYWLAICWLYTTARYNSFAYVGVTLLPIPMALFPIAGAWAVRRWAWPREVMTQFAAFASIWILADWMRTLGRLSFPWAQLGHPWVPWIWPVQLAEFVGESAVSLLVLFFSAALLAAIRLFACSRRESYPRLGAIVLDEEDRTDRKEYRKELFACLFLILTIGGTSIGRGHQWRTLKAYLNHASPIRVAAVQPNIEQDEKMASYMHPDPEVRAVLLERGFLRHQELLLDMVPPDTALVVMPESTFPAMDFVLDRPLHDRIGDVMDQIGDTSSPSHPDLLFGAVRWVNPGGESEETYNSAFFFPEGRRPEAWRYQDKMRLVPFGEHLPYLDLIPGFNDTFVGILSFNEGKQVNLMRTDGLLFGSMICFESAYAASARSRVRAGAQFLVVITNDGWYGMSAGPAQHHSFSILRAVEQRRPLIRAANTGISSIIEPSGVVSASLALGETGVVSAMIKPEYELTTFARFGNAPLMSALTIFLVVVAVRQRREGHDRSDAKVDSSKN